MFTLGEVMLTGLVAGVVGTGLSAAEPARERPRLWVRRIAGVRGSFGPPAMASRRWCLGRGSDVEKPRPTTAGTRQGAVEGRPNESNPSRATPTRH